MDVSGISGCTSDFIHNDLFDAKEGADILEGVYPIIYKSFACSCVSIFNLVNKYEFWIKFQLDF